MIKKIPIAMEMSQMTPLHGREFQKSVGQNNFGNKIPFLNVHILVILKTKKTKTILIARNTLRFE